MIIAILVGFVLPQSLVFGRVFCLSAFDPFLVIVMSVVLRFTTSDYLFGIFNLSVCMYVCVFDLSSDHFFWINFTRS